MPTFGLSKALGVGRRLKVFVNFQAGATRGEVPDPWSRVDQSRSLKKKDQELKSRRRRIRKMRGNLRRQSLDIFRLENELRTLKERAAQDPDPASAPPAEGGSLPDFVIVGAQKCGTTRLYNFLAQHPDVEAAAVSEVHFFDIAERFGRGIEWYRRFFLKPGAEDGRGSITGEKTPSYLFHPEVPRRMARAMPGVRLISLLRNPVDRALSHYNHIKRNEKETRGFEEVLDEERAWLAEGNEGAPDRDELPGLLSRGVYADQLLRWREFFPEGQMLVIKSEDFFADVPGTLERTQDFLDLPRHGLADPPRRTESRSYEPMDPATRERLEAFFAPHNRRLYDLLGRDFGW